MILVRERVGTVLKLPEWNVPQLLCLHSTTPAAAADQCLPPQTPSAPLLLWRTGSHVLEVAAALMLAAAPTCYAGSIALPVGASVTLHCLPLVPNAMCLLPTLLLCWGLLLILPRLLH
jgi:hypothetical protein